MKFLVMSEKDIKDYYTGLDHIIISISSPGSFKTYIPHYTKCLDKLYLEFSDIDNPNHNYPKYVELFTKRQAQTILDFVNQYKNRIDLIICQCEAGVSRSAGVAGALSKILNGDDFEFFRNYLPNMLVYNTIIKENTK